MKMVAFRNMISHQYADVSGRVVYEVVQTRIDDIRDFKQKILDRI
ncbi:MAG: HepT-like ribonuclease domain-containing protein [Negativicutes bacterium]